MVISTMTSPWIPAGRDERGTSGPCKVDDKNYSGKARTVRMLQAQFTTVNASAIPSAAITVPFYEAHYVPYVEAVLKPSSIHG
jgi:hypothetical protein